MYPGVHANFEPHPASLMCAPQVTPAFAQFNIRYRRTRGESESSPPPRTPIDPYHGMNVP